MSLPTDPAGMPLGAGGVRAPVIARPRLRATSLLLSLFGSLAACNEPHPGPDGPTSTSPTSAGAAATTAAAATSSAVPPAASASASQAPAAGNAAAAKCPEGMVHLPAATFRMGSPPEDKDADPDERPVREVKLTAYCLDRTEVTVDQYARCAAERRNDVTCSAASAVVVSRGLGAADVIFWSRFCNAGQKDRGDHPVNCVDWKQAATYCKWAGGRLPTEAEWEYAARGDDGRKYPWGNEAPSAGKLNACGSECSGNAVALGRKDKKSMYEGDDGAERTAPVGRYPEGKSPAGALDMAGNVWEWTADGHAPYDPARTDNPVVSAGPARVVRGGHWLNAGPQSPRGANRESRSEEKRLEDVGFRCAAGPSQ